MVSKKVHCAYCQKKCSGNVLRYQDQYYHKQCFELEQSESLASDPDASSAAAAAAAATSRQPAASPHAQPAGSFSELRAGRQRQDFEPPVRLAAGQLQSSPQQASGQQENVVTNNNNSATSHPTRDPGSGMMSASNGHSATRTPTPAASQRSATLPHSISSPANGFSSSQQQQRRPGGNSRTLDSRDATATSTCAGCREKILDGQALVALDQHWHVWCFKCAHCRGPLHGEYVAKGGNAYCEKDYQKLFGITCVYCKRYITGKVLQAGEAHHFHPSCARCSKCGDPFVPGEEMYLQGEVTWHPRCGPGPNGAESSLMEADDRQSQVSLGPF